MGAARHTVFGVLNWGLGHASRCMPLIDQALSEGDRITLASDGDALTFLQAHYPELATLRLPGYDIHYAEKDRMLMTLVAQLPKLARRIRAEHKAIESFLADEPADRLISDSRFGLHTDQCHTIFLTHQVFIQSAGMSTAINTVNHRYLRRFDEVWVPDVEGGDSLAGALSQGVTDFDKKYIGPLSRFSRRKDSSAAMSRKAVSGTLPALRQLTALLSGPEPQRSLLEDALTSILKEVPDSLLVRGVVGDHSEKRVGHCRIIGHLTTQDLERELRQSRLLICRSGYSSIMDLAAIGDLPAILIPTPGQTEQEYLAEYLGSRMEFTRLDQSEIAERLPSLLHTLIA